MARGSADVVRPALRGLIHYRRGHLLVAAATAVAAAVLVGALAVGDSVRGSLRAVFTERLGEADFAVLPRHPFSDDPATGLAARLASQLEREAPGWFESPAPALRLMGAVFLPDGAPEAVTVFGVDDRYFALHRVPGPVSPGAVRVSPGLALQGIEPGDSLLIRVDGVSGIASASFFGDKGASALTFRRTVEAWAEPRPGPASGGFSLFPVQGPVRAVFLPLGELRALLDEDFGGPPRANALLFRAAGAAGAGDEGEAVLAAALDATASLDDRGLGLRRGESGDLVLESRSLALADHEVDGAVRAAEARGLRAAPVLTWLATSMAANGRETPYSLVAGLPEGWFPPDDDPGDVLLPGPWLTEDLDLTGGDAIEVSYLVWDEAGRFEAAAASLPVGPGVALDGVFRDTTLAPELPGVTDSARMGDWDPPFPLDLSRIRDRDEEYWDDFGALPKAFVPYATARRLWEMRQGSATSVRFRSEGSASLDPLPLEESLVAELPAADFGLAPVAVRAQGLEASRGATDFGIYFLYFSWFLLVSAFVLIALLFRLGIERRLREIGLLLACGWPPKRVSRTLLLESLIVATVGVVVGSALGLLYARGMVGLLSGVWGGAVTGTLAASDGGAEAPLQLFVSWGSVTMGALGALEMALIAAWWTTRRLVRLPPRPLLAGSLPTSDAAGPLPAPDPGRRARRLAVGLAVVGVGLAGAAAAGIVPETGGFFGAGSALLAAGLAAGWRRLVAAGAGGALAGLRELAFRAAGFRPGRSLAAMALVAFAAFTLVAVESFRKQSGAGGLPEGVGGVLALTETVLGAPWDPTTAEGQEALNLPAGLEGFRVSPLRLAGHEDASCLNLYRPARPRVLGVPPTLREENRFPFAAHMGETAAETANPWRLLERARAPSDPIPVIGDQNSMTYVLKWPVGEERSYPIGDGGAPVRLRLVATLWDSLFQGELLMAEEDLLDSLPVEDGYRMFLVDRPGEVPVGAEALAAAESAATALLADALSDYGAASTAARARLESFHQVENTYLSTFQALGGLGLLLGTLGLGAVLLRNADERKKEWALLAAAGYRRRDFASLGFWENALLLLAGVGVGAGAAIVSVLPVLGQRGAGGSLGLLAVLLSGIVAFGLLTGALAARRAATRPILPALRAE